MLVLLFEIRVLCQCSLKKGLFMKTKLIFGNVGGLPVRGSYHEIRDGEASELLSSAARAAKGLLKIGLGVGLGLGLLSFLRRGKDRNDEPGRVRVKKSSREMGSYHLPPSKSPEKEFRERLFKIFTIDEMALVRTDGQIFTGICIDDELSFYCCGSKKSIPIGMVKTIERAKTDKGHYCLYNNVIVLFDGSTYIIDDLGDDAAPELNFYSVSGLDKVRLGSRLMFVRGTSKEYRLDFLSDIRKFVLENRKSLNGLATCDKVKEFLSRCQPLLGE